MERLNENSGDGRSGGGVDRGDSIDHGHGYVTSIIYYRDEFRGAATFLTQCRCPGGVKMSLIHNVESVP